MVLDQDNNFYLISLNFLITSMVDNVWYYGEKLHFNNFWELKAIKTWCAILKHSSPEMNTKKKGNSTIA